MTIEIGIGLLVLAALASFGLLSAYNRCNRYRNYIRSSKAQIDVELKRRSDLIRSLVSTIDGLRFHETDAWVRVLQARAKVMVPGHIMPSASDEFVAAIMSFRSQIDPLPNLRAADAFIKLMDELRDTEQLVAASRKKYNDSVLEYQHLQVQFPTSFFCSADEVRYFEVDSASTEMPTIAFSQDASPGGDSHSRK